MVTVAAGARLYERDSTKGPNCAMLCLMAGKDFTSWVNTRWSILERIWPGLVLAAGGSALTAFTQFLNPYAPLSYFAVAIVSFLAWLVADEFFRRRKIHQLKEARFADLRQPKSQFNPAEDHFEKARILIEEFFLPTIPEVEDKSFLRCDLIGTTNIVFMGCTLEDIVLTNCDLVLMRHPPNGRMAVHNARRFVGCTFRKSRFINCTLYCDEAMYRILHEMMKGEDNWITATPHEPPQWANPKGG